MLLWELGFLLVIIGLAAIIIDYSFAQQNKFEFPAVPEDFANCDVKPAGVHPKCGAYNDDEGNRPTLIAPDDVSMQATAFETPKSDVNLGSPTVTGEGWNDLSEDEAPVVRFIAPEKFPLGVTKVEWTATLQAESSNTGETITIVAEAEQFITIIDVTKPEFLEPGKIIEVTSNNPEGGIVSYELPSASDVVGIKSITCDPPPGSNFALGDTKLLCVATDNYDNSEAAEYILRFTFADNIKPQFNDLPNIQVQTDDLTGTVVTYDVPIATDNSGIVDVTCSPPPNTKFAVGETTVTCTAVDDAGNLVSGTFIVTVGTSDELQKEVERVPSWIKNNARWWSEGQINDSDFASGIQFLIQNKIIDVSFSTQNTASTEEDEKVIPSWVKTTAGWWANDQLPEEEFLRGLQYLVEKGIIRV